jgi:RNA polymerase sporulation-specific sigma factor
MGEIGDMEPCREYNSMTDEELIEQVRKHQPDAMDYLMDKYRNLVKRETREVYIIGADSEDLMQEGMIGLFKAIRDFDADKNSSFYSFASLCIKRQIYTAVTSSNRKKHSPLNNYVSFYSEEDEEHNRVLDTLAAQEESNPETNMLIQERVGGLMKFIETSLSKYERNVLTLYLDGQSYLEIAETLGKTEKSIDNAIQRIRKKLSEMFK